MALNPQWGAFIGLVAIDAQRSDFLGEQARSLQTVLGEYMLLRFGSSNTAALVDIVNSTAVVSAVSTSLNHATQDDAAIKAAVAAVTGA